MPAERGVLGMGASLALIVAWLVSALAGGVAHTAGRAIAASLLGAPFGLSFGLLYFSLLMFALGLVVQLIYGWPLYIFLTNLGLFNPVVVIVAYVLPAMILCFIGSDTPKDLLMGASWVLQGFTLGLITWVILSHSSIAR
jgi:hypothetical protein